MMQNNSEDNRDSFNNVAAVAKLQEQNKNILRKLDELLLAVHGEPGCNESTGLVVRVDRLEQMQKIHMWVIRTLGVAVAGGLIESAFRYAGKFIK